MGWDGWDGGGDGMVMVVVVVVCACVRVVGENSHGRLGVLRGVEW